MAQRIENTSDGTLAATITFGTLTPGLSSTPSSISIPFRLRNNSNTGYHLEVSSVTFNASATAPAAGGSTISASDIGVGITSIVPAPGFNGTLPRNDVVASGLNYDPSTVTATNGLTPYVGLASGQATLQDLINTPNLTVLTGNKIHSNTTATGSTNYLTVTVKFGLVRQYLTPANFTGVVTLKIVNGP